MRANGVRGEVIATLAGADRRLCLTLGALAEIETALGCDGLTALAERMRALSARDLGAVLAALLRGGGEDAFADAVLEADDVRTANLRATFAEVFPSADRARTYAVLRVRAVTEEI